MPRLTDIVVTEVSLVTRAANKRKFLLFKSDPEENHMDSAKLEAIHTAVKDLGTSVNAFLEKTGAKVDVPKSAEVSELVKSVGGLTAAIETAFKKHSEDQQNAEKKIGEQAEELRKLTEECDDLKKKLEVAQNEIPDEVFDLLEEVKNGLPTDETLKDLLEKVLNEKLGLKPV